MLHFVAKFNFLLHNRPFLPDSQVLTGYNQAMKDIYFLLSSDPLFQSSGKSCRSVPPTELLFSVWDRPRLEKRRG